MRSHGVHRFLLLLVPMSLIGLTAVHPASGPIAPGFQELVAFLGPLLVLRQEVRA